MEAIPGYSGTVGWGPGGAAANALVLGRLKAEASASGAAAVRVQRLWRLKQVPRCLVARCRCERACLAVQRVVRGWIGRCFVDL